MNKILISVGLLALTMTTAMGCGGGGSGGGPPARPGKVNTAGAATVVEQTNTMQAALKANDGTMLSSSVITVSLTGAQQIVTPMVGAALTGTTSAALSSPGPNGGSVNCDQSGCVYTMYKSGGLTMNGGVKAAATGDTIKVTENLTVSEIDMTGLAGTVDWDLSGDLTFTPTSIAGTLQSDGHFNINAGGMAVSEDFYNLLQYNAVVLGTNATAVGGSLYAKWGVTVVGVPAASQAWEGTVNFP